MRFIKSLLLIGVILVSALFIKGSGASNQLDYERENAIREEAVDQYLSKANDVEKEFVNKLLNYKEEDGLVNISNVKNIDTEEGYKYINGRDSIKDIDVNGRIPGIVWIRKGNDRYWIDTNRKIYYTEKFDYSQIQKDLNTYNTNINRVYEKFAAGNDKTVEKLEDGGYRVTCVDDLNYGSYIIYDSNLNSLESFTDNSQGRWLEQLESSDGGVEQVFNDLLDLTKEYQKTEDRSDID